MFRLDLAHCDRLRERPLEAGATFETYHLETVPIPAADYFGLPRNECCGQPVRVGATSPTCGVSAGISRELKLSLLLNKETQTMSLATHAALLLSVIGCAHGGLETGT